MITAASATSRGFRVSHLASRSIMAQSFPPNRPGDSGPEVLEHLGDTAPECGLLCRCSCRFLLILLRLCDLLRADEDLNALGGGVALSVRDTASAVASINRRLLNIAGIFVPRVLNDLADARLGVLDLTGSAHGAGRAPEHGGPAPQGTASYRHPAASLLPSAAPRCL